MADKIIPLNPNGNGSEKRKFSEILYDFVEPFIDRYPDDVYLEDIFWDGIAAWNVAVMSSLLPEQDRKGAQQVAIQDNDENIFFWEFIERKDKDFPDFDYLYDHIEFIIEGDEEHFVVEVRGLDSVFDRMDETLNQPFESTMDDDGVVDRTAVIIRPKQKFIDWFNDLYPDEPLTHEDIEPSIYLISDEGNHYEEAFEAHFKKRFDRYFKMELENWESNKKKWPQKRTYKMFIEWFDVQVSGMVYDMEKTPILKF